MTHECIYVYRTIQSKAQAICSAVYVCDLNEIVNPKTGCEQVGELTKFNASLCVSVIN